MNKLVKLLNLTASTSDGECLNAIRAANRILIKSNRQWSDVLANGGRQKPRSPWEASEPPPEDLRNPEIEMMFELVLSRMDEGKPREFITSLNIQFQRRRRLSDKQYEALKKFYRNLA